MADKDIKSRDELNAQDREDLEFLEDRISRLWLQDKRRFYNEFGGKFEKYAPYSEKLQAFINDREDERKYANSQNGTTEKVDSMDSNPFRTLQEDIADEIGDNIGLFDDLGGSVLSHKEPTRTGSTAPGQVREPMKTDSAPGNKEVTNRSYGRIEKEVIPGTGRQVQGLGARIGGFIGKIPILKQLIAAGKAVRQFVREMPEYRYIDGHRYVNSYRFLNKKESGPSTNRLASALNKSYEALKSRLGIDKSSKKRTSRELKKELKAEEREQTRLEDELLERKYTKERVIADPMQKDGKYISGMTIYNMGAERPGVNEYIVQIDSPAGLPDKDGKFLHGSKYIKFFGDISKAKDEDLTRLLRNYDFVQEEIEKRGGLLGTFDYDSKGKPKLVRVNDNCGFRKGKEGEKRTHNYYKQQKYLHSGRNSISQQKEGSMER